MERDTKTAGAVMNKSKEELQHERQSSVEKRIEERLEKKDPVMNRNHSSEHNTNSKADRSVPASPELPKSSSHSGKPPLKKIQPQQSQESNLPPKILLSDRIQQLHLKGLITIREPRTPVRAFHDSSPANINKSVSTPKKNEGTPLKKGDSSTTKSNGVDSFPNPSLDNTPTLKKSNNTSMKKEEPIKVIDDKYQVIPQSERTKGPEEAQKPSKIQNMLLKVIPGKHARNASEHAASKLDHSSSKPQNKGNSCMEIQNSLSPKAANENVPMNPKNFMSEEISGKKKANAALTESEKATYGDRFPSGYKKLEFLGRGGFALVWLGVQEATGQKFAIKQIILSKASSNVMNEVIVGRMLFQVNPTSQEKLQSYPGINHIIKFVDCIETTQDLWLVFELGGTTLSKSLFEIKGEFYKGERIYGIRYPALYKSFQENSLYLKSFIRQMAEVLCLLSDLKIVHCDLKPDNILVGNPTEITDENFQIKIIDFGSVFSLKESGSLGNTTPEYMPPEVLRLISNNRSGRTPIEELARISPPWAVDTWSLGAMVLEIVCGMPLWMNLRTKVEQNGKSVIKTGLFAVNGREYDKIRIRQKAVVDSLQESAGEYLKNFKNNEDLLDLLIGLLQLEPKKRLSPQEILNHRYLAK